MLKSAACVWVVAVGIFLIVTAETDTGVSPIDYYEEPFEKNLTEEGVSSTRKINELEEEESTEAPLINSHNEPSEATFTEEVVSTEVDEYEDDNTSKDSENTNNGEDGIKLPRVPKRRKFEEDEESEERTTVCGAPPEIEGATISNLESTEHRVGTNISYQCNFGYVSRGFGAFLSVCKIDEQTGEAKWSKPDISCVSRSCGDPGYVANARRIGNLFTFPNKVEFQCEEGYKIRGLRARYCQANGEWSGRLPNCEQVYCSVPRDIENGRVGYSSLEYGTELRYECNNGFALTNHQPRLCTNNGTWSNNEPECIEIRCKMPESPVRGSVQLLGEPKVGSLALYFCDEGTTMVGTSTSKCLRSGHWTFDPPKCMTSCKITDIQDGAIGRLEKRTTWTYSLKPRKTTWEFIKFQVGEIIQYNETVTLKCNEGFTPTNSSTRSSDDSEEVTCIGGLWNKPMLCHAKKCLGQPPPIENGVPVVNDNSHGAVIWYRCDPDFERAKSGKIKCDHGTWKGYTPVCADTRCYLAQLDFPGLVKPQGTFLKTNTLFNIACSSGYKKIGSEEKIRCVKGEWKIVKNPCKIESCDDDPPAVPNGRPSQFNREHGSLVQYECDEHFDLVGISRVRCNAGKWEGEPSSCQESITSVATTTENSLGHELGVTPQSLNFSPSSNPAEACFCTYDYEPQLVLAMVNGRRLENGEKVNKGETVSFNCRFPNMNLKWQNGLVMSGTVNMTCSACKKWLQTELLTCVNNEPGSSAIIYNDQMRILPRGVIEISAGKNFEVICRNPWVQPRWYPPSSRGIHYTVDHEDKRRRTGVYAANLHIFSASSWHEGRYECFSTVYPPTVLELRIAEPEIQCPELREGRKFFITYENDRKVNSDAYYACKDSSQKIIGESSRKCLKSGRWSGTYPSCEDITCWTQSTYNGLLVSYTNYNKVNSIAKFRCSNQRKLVGSNSTVCQHNGSWSNPWPTCEMLDIRCPQLDKKGIFTISYSNDRRVNSTAQFYCIQSYKKTEGCSVMTCQQNGEWSGTYPTCEDYISCVEFEDVPGLEVSYSKGVKVGSVASFYCQPSYTLLGSPSATCRVNGTWSNLLPTCEAPKCSIDELFSTLPEGVVADLSEMVDQYAEFVSYGTEIRLLCEDDLIHIGSSKATCELPKKWEFGNVQCVPGCRLNKNEESHLLTEPVKEYYRFGDYILLSCPPGQKLNGEVERVMCLGKSWSHELPDCIEITQTSPSALRETRKSS